MEELSSQFTSLLVFLLAVTGLLLGLPWLFWTIARILKLGRFHPLAKRN